MVFLYDAVDSLVARLADSLSRINAAAAISHRHKKIDYDLLESLRIDLLKSLKEFTGEPRPNSTVSIF